MNQTTNAIDRQKGLTLIELIVAIAIAVVLLTMAVPSLQEIIKNNRVTSQSNELMAMINLARNEAIRRNIVGDDNRRAVVRFDTNGASSWSANVSVVAGETTEGCPPGVLRCTSHTNASLTVTSNSNELSFNNRGYLIEGGDSLATEYVCLRHEPCTDGQRQHRRITIRGSGQIVLEPEVLACNAACDPGS